VSGFGGLAHAIPSSTVQLMRGIGRFLSNMVAVVAIDLCAQPVAADEPAPTVITAPHWLERPSAIDVAAAYPDRAQRAQISGKAIVACRVGGDGRLYQCRVFAEAPLGEQFGAAALSLTPKFRMTPPAQPRPGVAPTIFIPIHMLIVKLGPHTNQEDPKPLVLASPRWASAPSFDDMAQAFPRAAGSGAADIDLRCNVGPDGAAGPCEVLKERPAHEGFAEAALSLAPRFRVDMGGRPPRPDDDFVADITIHFADPKSEDFLSHGIGQPAWITAPSEDEAEALFPAEAAARGLKAGRGVAACTVAADGSLRDCVPRPGDPDGLGFSEAAVKIASMMRMNPWTQAGGPVAGAHVELPIRFDLSSAKP
jgi:TonB family protein